MKILGVYEVAEFLNWDKRKVAVYMKRKNFPKPVKILKATPLWTIDQIKDYLDKIKEKNNINLNNFIN
jgi:hypothetical protein